MIGRIGSKKSIAIIYCGSVEGVARHLESILRISRPGTNLLTMHGDYIHNIMLPYVSESIDQALIFSHSLATSCLLRAYQSLKLLGIDLLAVVSKPTGVERPLKFDEENIIEIDENVYRVATTLASIKIGVELGGSIQRIKRMEQEVTLSSIVGDIIKKFREDADKVRECELIATTHSMLSVAEELGDIGYLYTTVDKLHKLIMIARSVGIFYTTAEEHIVRETIINVKRLAMQKSFVEIKVNTDPFTAPLYGLIIASYISLKNLRGEESTRLTI
ncbi:MAG: hypothetical protein QW632_01585 [Ignisphaera sp.]